MGKTAIIMDKNVCFINALTCFQFIAVYSPDGYTHIEKFNSKIVVYHADPDLDAKLVSHLIDRLADIRLAGTISKDVTDKDGNLIGCTITWEY